MQGSIYLGVIFIGVSCSMIQCCSEDFFRASSDTCLHIAKPSANSMNAYCKGRQSKLYSRPLTEDLSESLAQEMMKESEGWMPEEAYLGMQNKEENDAWSAGSRDWHFEGEDDKEFPDTEYKWWYKMPQQGENCAISSMYSNFKAKPHDCNQQIASICEKEKKPCYDDDLPYIEYRGFCLAVVTDKKMYAFAASGCKNGHLMHLKSEKNLESLYQAFYNAKFNGGVYIGLNKSNDGRFLYKNGEAELNGFGKDDRKLFECAGVRIVGNNTLSIYSIPCDRHRLHFLCEVTVTDDAACKNDCE